MTDAGRNRSMSGEIGFKFGLLFGPMFVEDAPKSVNFGRSLAQFGQIRAKFGLLRAMFGRFRPMPHLLEPISSDLSSRLVGPWPCLINFVTDGRPNLAEIGQTLVDIWPMLWPSLVVFGRYQAIFGRSRANFGRFRATVGPFRTNLGRCWPSLGQMLPKSHQFRAKLSDAGRSCPKFGHIRVRRMYPELGKCRLAFHTPERSSSNVA